MLWQHPSEREIIPIGRMTYDGEAYGFDYTVAASRIQHFRPLSGLGRFGEHFENPVLPAIFRQRIMDTARPDFGNYATSLGLTTETATPWEQIVQSGGERAGDTLQFMQIPDVVNGQARARFLVSGVRHIPESRHQLRVGGRDIEVSHAEHESALASLRPGSAVTLLAEDDNPKDPQAMLVSGSGTPLGWVPRLLAPAVRDLQVHQGDLSACVVRVNGPSSPPHLRLVLDLDAPAPQGFSFDPDGMWEPFSS
ncbi:MAG: hypothetical protein ACTMIR_06185 [Cellulomonadaceae bacterium]